MSKRKKKGGCTVLLSLFAFLHSSVEQETEARPSLEGWLGAGAKETEDFKDGTPAKHQQDASDKHRRGSRLLGDLLLGVC